MLGADILSEDVVGSSNRPIPIPTLRSLEKLPPGKASEIWIGTWKGKHRTEVRGQSETIFEFYLRIGEKDERPVFEKYSFKRDREPIPNYSFGKGDRDEPVHSESYLEVLPGFSLKQRKGMDDERYELTIDSARFNRNMTRLTVEYIIHKPTKGGNIEEVQDSTMFELKVSDSGEYVIEQAIFMRFRKMPE